MTVHVYFSGPAFSRTVELQPGAAPIDVGRDPQAGIHLPDNDRLISRRHLTLEWAEGGVKVVVLSKVNGIITAKGEFGQGQHVLLAPGDSAQLGHFSLQVRNADVALPLTTPVPMAARGAAAEDPFHAFGMPPPSALPSSVFDDPFFHPQQAAMAPPVETPVALHAMSAQAAPGYRESFSGVGGMADPLAAFGGQQAPVHSSASIDDFLGMPSRQPTGLGAAHLLRPESASDAARLATDHVHDFNLPVRSLGIGTPQSSAPAPAPAPVVASPTRASADPFAALDLLAGSAPPSDAPPVTSVSVAPAAEPSKIADPWDDIVDFARQLPAGADGGAATEPGARESRRDDVFLRSATWRIESPAEIDAGEDAPPPNEAALAAAFAVPGTRRPDTPAGDAASPQADALKALCRGLGITEPAHMDARSWEQLGASVRQIVQALTDLTNARSELKREMRATDRTMLGAQENNPLKGGMSIEELLQYLLFMPQGIAGYMPAQRALQESVEDLRAHEFASLAAIRAAVEGSIKEFDPGKLRPTLLKNRSSIVSLMDNARLWELYTNHYAHKSAHMADWLEQVFNRHFMPTYTREAERLRREAQPRPPKA